MPDFKRLYRYSLNEALELNERDKWRESYAENKRCRDFIDEQIRQNFDGLYLNGDIPQKTVAEFGFDRTRWVLANHIQHYDHDRRISNQNKVWAEDVYIPRPSDEEKGPHIPDHTEDYLLNSHAVLVDRVADQVQQMYAGLNLYDHRHRVPDSEMSDYTDKILIIRAEWLKESSRTPENQLFLASSGFGCDPSAVGRAVYGKFLIDGENARLERGDFIGVADERYLPEWAMDAAHPPEKLRQGQQTASNVPEEGSQPVMKGI